VKRGMPPPRVLITGGGGQLGRALAARLERRAPGKVWAPSRAQLDITDLPALRAALASRRPDWIVNCAAYTAVDAAEGDRQAAFRVNGEAVGVLADLAFEGKARLLHLSTDYVFDGLKEGPYLETDPPAPVNVYGASKLRGEELLLGHPARWTVLRTAWLYGEEGGSFFGKVIERARRAIAAGESLPIVCDQVGSPTDVHTLSAQIEAVLAEGFEGLFHAAAEGAASWYQFAEEIFAGLGLRPRLVPIPGEELRRPARRPPRVVLENAGLKARGRSLMIPWQEGVRLVVARLERARA
jgi:dTDP-4-dehydrorhamnose reductase